MFFPSTAEDTMSHVPCPMPHASHLVGVQEEEGHHEGEQAGSFGESETKNGVREELTC